MSGRMSRLVHMLYESKWLQQLSKPHSVYIVSLVDVYVEIATNDDRAVVHCNPLEHGIFI